MGIYPEKELMDSYFVVKVFQVFAQIYLAIIPLDFGPVKGLYIRDVFINIELFNVWIRRRRSL
jgi:hypothetical protein